MKITTYTLGDFATNCYLVVDEGTKKACLIDPGIYDVGIQNEIIAKGITLEYILLTHGHFDHILGANALKEKTGAMIVAYKDEVEYFEDQIKNLPPVYDCGTIVIDRHVVENDVLIFGSISFRVIHTPGHTIGSCCFVCEDEKVMFTGDTLFKGSIGRYDFPGGDYGTILQSLQKLKDFEQNYEIYPGHGDFTTLDDERAHNPYIK